MNKVHSMGTDIKAYAKTLIVIAFLILGVALPVLFNATATLVAQYPAQALLVGFIATMAVLAIVFKLLDAF